MASVKTVSPFDSYESICDYARARSEKLDLLRWRLGDCANLIAHKYSEHTILEFAKDIGQHKSTVYQYAKVAAFYKPRLRRRLFRLFPNLSYSHMRDAMRLKDKKTAVTWLKQCSDNGWTADESARNLTKQLGHETEDAIEGIISEVDWHSNKITIELSAVPDFMTGQLVRIKVLT